MERLTLWEMILNKIDNGIRGYSNELAEIAGFSGLSKGSNLKKVLRDEKKEFENFTGLVKLVRYLFGEDEQKLLEAYSKTIDPNNKTARAMLEYLSVNRLLDSMRELIERMETCKNKESREFAKVYCIHYEWQTNYYKLDKIKFINDVNEVKTNIVELKVKLNLLKFYGFYRMEDYRSAFNVSKFIDCEIEAIKDDYIKSIYKTRYNEAMSYIYLRVMNQPEEAIKRAKLIIEENNVVGAVAYAYYTIGCANMFTSYDESLKNLNKSIELYQNAKRDESVINDIKDRIDLLNVLWDKNKEIYTLKNKLYQLAKRGNLRDIDLNNCKQKLQKNIYLLLKGIVENSTDFLLQSLIQYIKQGDAFFANIPKFELLKRNYNEDTINLLVSINNPA